MININILIVDDEVEKGKAIAVLLAKSAGSAIDIVHTSNATEARLRLRERRFDIVLIDVNLPNGLKDAPSVDAGFQLFDMLRADQKSNLPDDVIFVTALEDLRDVAQMKAAKRGATLCFYRPGANDWMEVLSGRVGYIMARKKRHAPPKVDVAIVTALSTPELDAVLNLDFGWSRKSLPGDPTTYYFGSTEADGRIIELVAACAPRKGMPVSAALSAKMVKVFKPSLLVMLGICAGVKGKVSLGDVVVADPTWDWGSGKHTAGTDSLPLFRAAPYQSALRQDVAALVQASCREVEICNSIRGGWGGRIPESRLGVHLGPMASGASVLANDEALSPIIDGHREVIAIEMEAFAVMAAAELCGSTPLVIKSVCDFADSSKSDDWQSYAAYTSASYFCKLLPSLAEAGIC